MSESVKGKSIKREEEEEGEEVTSNVAKKVIKVENDGKEWKDENKKEASDEMLRDIYSKGLEKFGGSWDEWKSCNWQVTEEQIFGGFTQTPILKDESSLKACLGYNEIVWEDDVWNLMDIKEAPK